MREVDYRGRGAEHPDIFNSGDLCMTGSKRGIELTTRAAAGRHSNIFNREDLGRCA